MANEYILNNRKDDYERKKRLAIIVSIVSLVAFILFVLIVSLVAIPMIGDEKTVSPTKAIESKKGLEAIITDNPQCSKIASNTLKSNGSAVDAVLAALLCTSVLSPDLAGLGGGFQLLSFGREAIAIDATPMPRSGKNSSGVGIPRMLSGIMAARSESSKMTFKDLVKPSIDLARNAKVSPRLARAISSRGICDKPNALRDWLCVNGVAKSEGESMKNEDLAVFLEKLIAADDPVSVFAAAVKNDSVGLGLDENSLKKEVSKQEFLKFKLGSEEFVTSPTAACKQLRLGSQIMSELPVDKNSSEVQRYHYLSEALKFSIGADPGTLDDLSAPDLAGKVKPDGVLNASQYGLPDKALKLQPQASVMLMVTTTDSLAVITASLGTQFGSSILSDNGFIYNQISVEGNDMVSYSCPAVMSTIPDEFTALLPDSSSTHSLCASIQVLSAVRSIDPSDALVQKRISTRREPEPTLYYEQGFSEGLLSSLKELGHNVEKDIGSVGMHFVSVGKQVSIWNDNRASVELLINKNETSYTTGTVVADESNY